MAFVIVERDLPEKRPFDELQSIEDAHQWCLDMYEVTFVRSYFANDGLRMICLYEAPDAESVRIAQRKAGLPVSACYTVEIHEAARPDRAAPTRSAP